MDWVSIALVGSRLHGTDGPDSDVDIKGVYIPAARNILLGNYRKSFRETKDKNEIEFLSLDNFLNQLASGSTNAIDMLFSSKATVNPAHQNLWKEIYDNRRRIIKLGKLPADRYGIRGKRVAVLKSLLALLNSCNDTDKLYSITDMLDKFTDQNFEYVQQEWIAVRSGEDLLHLNVCGKKMPFSASVQTARQVYTRLLKSYGKRAIAAEQSGFDWKALSHGVRISHEFWEYLETGKITFPRPERQLLTDIKGGKIAYKEVAAILEDLASKIEMFGPYNTNPMAVDDIIFSVYAHKIKVDNDELLLH